MATFFSQTFNPFPCSNFFTKEEEKKSKVNYFYKSMPAGGPDSQISLGMKTDKEFKTKTLFSFGQFHFMDQILNAALFVLFKRFLSSRTCA